MGRFITFLILLALFLPPPVPGRRISCTSSESVHEGKSAVISCDYHVNLRNSRRGFYIYKYPFGGKDPDVPAICDWDEDFIRCDVRPGYDVRVQGHKMVMNISSAQQTHAGRYVCHVLQPEDDIQSQECDLVVQRIKNNVNVNCHAVKASHRQQPTTVMCFVSERLNATSIVLERREPSGTAEAAEIIRCDAKTNMCSTRDFGYQFTVQESVSTILKVLIAKVEKPGRYTCKAQGRYIQTEACEIEVDKDIEIVAAKETSSKHLVAIVYALSGIALLMAFCVVAAFCVYKIRKKRQKALARTTTVPDKETRRMSYNGQESG